MRSTEQAESFLVSRQGQMVRRICRSDGRSVFTVIGKRPRLPGETLDQAADRTQLTDALRPPGNSTGKLVRSVDFYAGGGGFSLGLSEACRATGLRFQPVCAIDNDPIALDVYAANLMPGFSLCADARDVVNGQFGGRLTPSERWFKRRVGCLDVLLAGPPCQGFSSLNNHTRGRDPKNRLYEHVARVVEVLEPEHVLIENVASVRSYSPSSVCRTLDRLGRLGYALGEGIVSVLDLGIPQRRRRHIVSASMTRETRPESVVEAFRRAPRNLQWAIRDLEGINPRSEFDEASVPSPASVKRMRYLREHKKWDLPDYLRPDCHSRVDHTYKSMYGRLKWLEPAQTVTSGFGSMGQGRYVHPNGRRTLTPHEAARLQFFPDWFRFGSQSRTAWARLIGNAVPMKLSYVFGVWMLR